MSNKISIKLEEITSNVFKRIFRRDICLPSDYIFEFNKEIEENKVDLESSISEELIKDYEKSKTFLNELEETLKSTNNILEDSITALAENNQKEVSKLKEDIKKLYNHINSLTNELYRDDLTHIYNRKWFFHEYLHDEQYVPNSGTMIFIDIDDFKNINDMYGHPIGDKVLRFFTNYVKKRLIELNYKKDQYSFIRFAGDEFILIIDIKDRNRIERDLKDIQKSMSTSKIIYKNSGFYLDFSYGIKEFEKGENVHDIMKDADNFMYDYKKCKKDLEELTVG